MKILVGINTIQLTDFPNDTFNSVVATRLRADGVWSVANHNAPGLTDDNFRALHNTLGPGYVVAEDGAFQTANYRWIRENIKIPNDYVSYTEPGAGPPWDTVTGEDSVTISANRIQWVLDNLSDAGISDVRQVAVLTRSYSGDWRPPVDQSLESPLVSGITIEMWPLSANFDAWHIGELIKKTLDAGKNCYLLLPTIKGFPDLDYLEEMKSFLRAVSNTGRLTDHRLFFVPAAYSRSDTPGDGGSHTTVFGYRNSIESAVSFLRNQPEWDVEWPIEAVDVDSELNSAWSKENIIDGRATSAWSSQSLPQIPSRPEALTLKWTTSRWVNYLRLRPRPELQCFPVEADIYCSDGSSWGQPVAIWRNRPSNTEDWLIIPFDRKVWTREVRIVAKKTTPDRHGGYYFQLIEAAVGCCMPPPS